MHDHVYASRGSYATSKTTYACMHVTLRSKQTYPLSASITKLSLYGNKDALRLSQLAYIYKAKRRKESSRLVPTTQRTRAEPGPLRRPKGRERGKAAGETTEGWMSEEVLGGPRGVPIVPARCHPDHSTRSFPGPRRSKAWARTTTRRSPDHTTLDRPSINSLSLPISRPLNSQSSPSPAEQMKITSGCLDSSSYLMASDIIINYSYLYTISLWLTCFTICNLHELLLMILVLFLKFV